MTAHESLRAGAEVVRGLRHTLTHYTERAEMLRRSRRRADRAVVDVAELLARDAHLRLYGAQEALRAVAGVDR